MYVTQVHRDVGTIIILIGRVWESPGCSAWPQTTTIRIVYVTLRLRTLYFFILFLFLSPSLFLLARISVLYATVSLSRTYTACFATRTLKSKHPCVKQLHKRNTLEVHFECPLLERCQISFLNVMSFNH